MWAGDQKEALEENGIPKVTWNLTAFSACGMVYHLSYWWIIGIPHLLPRPFLMAKCPLPFHSIDET